MSRAPTVVYFEGRFVAPDEARVPVTARGYALGLGVFATLRAYGGVCFRAREHASRLARGAALLRLPYAHHDEALIAQLDEAARRTGAEDAMVRVTLAAGEDDANASLSIVARPFTPPADDELHGGVDAVTSHVLVPGAWIGDPEVKTTSYAAHAFARRQAEDAGAREALVFTEDGAVVGGAMSNVFVVLGRELVTPALTSGCRAGVTRAAVLSLGESVGLTPHERRVERDELQRADEVFVTSSRVECLPLARLDGAPIGAARGGGPGRRGIASGHPHAAALRAALRRLVATELTARRAIG